MKMGPSGPQRSKCLIGTSVYEPRQGRRRVDQDFSPGWTGMKSPEVPEGRRRHTKTACAPDGTGPGSSPTGANQVVKLLRLSPRRHRLLLAVFPAPLEVSNGPLEGSNAPLEGSNEPLEGSNVPLEGSNVPLEVSNEPLEASNEPLEGSNAPLEGSNAPLEVSNGPLEGSNGPLEVSNGGVDDSVSRAEVHPLTYILPTAALYPSGDLTFCLPLLKDREDALRNVLP